MRPHEPASHLSQAAAAFDPSSDPRFLEYYARASQSAKTVGRFARIMDRALELRRAEGGTCTGLAVVDIGCGAGTQAALWAAAEHHVRAIDINAPLVAVASARAREGGLDVAFTVGSATALPFQSESADVVLMPELLEHVVEWERCLDEAVRILKPGGLLYLSTSSRLCPRQQEFNLPLYSWYPGKAKRWCEKKALTTRPQWANYARYPAIHWFSYYGLRRWFVRRGFRTLDRFDVLARRQPRGPKRFVAGVLKVFPPAKFLGHLAMEGTMVWAIKVGAK